jgi:DNA invertase Pin-like site-specific DNA recombinase
MTTHPRDATHPSQVTASPPKAARYLRVSRADQDPRLQADATAHLIERRGWECVDSFVDHGVSGSRERRPQLDRLLNEARLGRFQILVVYRSDRLFRSLRNMVATLDQLAALGVDFVSVTEPTLDSTTPQGRLVLHLTSAFAEFERSLLIERTRDGLAAARRRGSRIGRPRTWVDVERALELRGQGKSLRSIARELGVGASTVGRALRRHELGGAPKTAPESPPTDPAISGLESCE